MRKLRGSLFGFVLLLATTAQAQPPTSYLFKVFNQGATLPVSSVTLPSSGFTCGLTPKVPTPTAPVANPKRVIIDDPLNPLADCVFTDSGSGPLLALPFGTQIYTATIAGVYPAGNSSDTPTANSFTHPGVVGSAPTGARVVQ